MNKTQYTYLLAHPQHVSGAHVTALGTVLEAHPFFQSARALQLKGLKNQGSFLYNSALKKTAAHTTDRDVLFEYITSRNFFQNKISETILQHDASVFEIKTVSEQISATLHRELKEALKNP
ncbi:MAG: hypothetical protein ACPG7E_09215, partial [Marinirhabdus sp.]